jgi:hypothetical protein
MLTGFRGDCTDKSLPPLSPVTASADCVPDPNSCRLIQDTIFVPPVASS